MGNGWRSSPASATHHPPSDVIVNLEDGQDQNITHQPGSDFDESNDWAPAWSPDGAWIAFTTDRGDAEIYVLSSGPPSIEAV